MPERLTKAQSSERTRRALLDAAGRLYFERGFAATSLDDIASAAGVTKGAVYAHFDTKEDLLVALLGEVQSTLVDLSMFGSDATFGEQVRLFGQAAANEVRDPRLVAAQADYISIALRNQRARGVYAELIRTTLESLGAGVDAASEDPPGRFSGTDFVVVMDSLLQGLYIRRAVNPELVDDELIADAVSLVVSAFVMEVIDPDEAVKRRDAAAKRAPRARR